MSLLHRSGLVLGAFGLLAGAGMFLGATQIPSGFGYDAVGPATFPKIIALGLVASGAICLMEARRAPQAEDIMAPGNLVPVALISVTLLAAAALLKAAGWVPMAALIFVAGGAAFGSRSHGRNLAIGLAAATLVLLLFGYGLGIRLPLGVLASATALFR